MSAGGIRAGRSFITLSIDDRTRQGISSAQSNLRSYADNVGRIGRNLTVAGGVTTGIGVSLVAPLRASTVEAGNFNEEVNRFNATFGNNADTVRQFAKTYSDSINRFEGDTLRSLSSFQGFLRGLEFGQDEATGLSREILQLTEDFGSFFNVNSDLSRIKILGALAGETEGVKEFGVNVRVAAVDQELLRQGLNITSKDASEQQKVLARLAIVYRSLTSQGAVGDAIKTAKEFNNSQRGVEAGLKSVRVAIGQALIPLRTEWNGRLIQALRVSRDFIAGNQVLVRSFARTAAGIAAAGVVVAGAGGSFLLLSGVLRQLGGSASVAVAPISAVGAASTKAGEATSVFRSALAGLGQFGVGASVAVGALLRGLGGVVSALGVGTAAAVGFAFAVGAIATAIRPLQTTKQELTNLFSILSSLTQIIALLSAIPIDISEKLGFGRATRFATRLLSILLKIITTGENVNIQDEIRRFALGEFVRDRQQSGADLPQRLEQGTKQIFDRVTEEGTKLFEKLRGESGKTAKQFQVDGLKAADQLRSLTLASLPENVRKVVEDLRKSIEGEIGQAARPLGASPRGNLLTEINSLIRNAENAADTTKKSSAAIAARGTFFGQSAANIALGREATDELRTIVGQNDRAIQQRDTMIRNMENRPALRFG